MCVTGFRGHFEHPPDFVAHPRDEFELERVLEWCTAERVAAIPYGGGTSVVGGVRPQVPSWCNGALSLDLRALERVLEVDSVSRSARIQAGASGPGLEAQLGEHGLTLRHFPQSFEYSTLGGWIATRAAGHFAMGCTHIEDVVESIRALTPVGAWESRRLPGSGAGAQPRSAAGGLGGSPGRDLRGVGARAAAPHPPPLGGRWLSRFRAGRRVRAGAQPVGARSLPTAASSTPARRA